MGKFKELRVWNDAIELAEKIYYITQEPVFSKDFALRDQIRRAAISISSNIAEGDNEAQTGNRFIFFTLPKARLRKSLLS